MLMTVKERPVWGGVLLRSVNENNFFQFGAMLRPLQSIKAQAKLSDVFFILYNAKTWLEWFLSDKVVPLSVCKGSGYKLLSELNAIVDKYPNKLTPQTELEFGQFFGITNGARDFETVFTAEIQTLDTYFISQTGIYKTSDLIEHAERIFPEAVLDVIPDHAIKDIRDCGKCLAFDLPTAAGFHMLRAAEALIREYMTVVIGAPPKLKSRNWGRYIDILEKHGADQRILAALDQIREMHRNPIMHPEDFLSAEEAATLLGVAQGVIVFIAADIAKRKAAKKAEEEKAKAALFGEALGTLTPLSALKAPIPPKQLKKGGNTTTQSAS